jgi:hypothetical protein
MKHHPIVDAIGILVIIIIGIGMQIGLIKLIDYRAKRAVKNFVVERCLR